MLIQTRTRFIIKIKGEGLIMKRHRFRGYPEAILSGLSRSEINWELSFFYDAGYTAKLGNEQNGFKEVGECFKTLITATEWLSEQAIKHYPNSDFAQ